MTNFWTGVRSDQSKQRKKVPSQSEHQHQQKSLPLRNLVKQILSIKSTFSVFIRRKRFFAAPDNNNCHFTSTITTTAVATAAANHPNSQFEYHRETCIILSNQDLVKFAHLQLPRTSTTATTTITSHQQQQQRWRQQQPSSSQVLILHRSLHHFKQFANLKC